MLREIEKAVPVEFCECCNARSSVGQRLTLRYKSSHAPTAAPMLTQTF